MTISVFNKYGQDYGMKAADMLLKCDANAAFLAFSKQVRHKLQKRYSMGPLLSRAGY